MVRAWIANPCYVGSNPISFSIFKLDMKRSKLEAYRLYSLTRGMWSLVIRFDGDKEQIEKELDRIWVIVQKIDKLPASCPTLVVMNEAIERSSFIKKYI